MNDRGILGCTDDLQEQLAAVQAEITRLGGVCSDYRKTQETMFGDLAASQAREQQLREVLLYLGKEISEGQGVCIETVVEALFSPQDDTALRQWGAKLLREMVDQVVLGFGDYLRRKADELIEGKK